MLNEFLEYVQKDHIFFRCLFAALALAAGFLLEPIAHRWIAKWMPKSMDKGISSFFSSFTTISIRLASILMALAQLGVNLDILIGSLSAVGLGLSMALKDSMANVAGGIQILFTRPFSAGDYIGFEEKEGWVKRIEIMFTAVENREGQEILIPNSTLVSKTVINYTVTGNRKICIDIPLSNDAEFRPFCKRVVEILQSYPQVHQIPEPHTHFNGYTPDGHGAILRCVCFVENDDYWHVKEDMFTRIQDLKREFSISQPVSAFQMSAMEMPFSKTAAEGFEVRPMKVRQE